jgi:hypothetical protein
VHAAVARPATGGAGHCPVASTGRLVHPSSLASHHRRGRAAQYAMLKNLGVLFTAGKLGKVLTTSGTMILSVFADGGFSLSICSIS